MTDICIAFLFSLIKLKVVKYNIYSLHANKLNTVLTLFRIGEKIWSTQIYLLVNSYSPTSVQYSEQEGHTSSVMDLHSTSTISECPPRLYIDNLSSPCDPHLHSLSYWPADKMMQQPHWPSQVKE